MPGWWEPLCQGASVAVLRSAADAAPSAEAAAGRDSGTVKALWYRRDCLG